ncbi:MAG: pentapeptide repeat-containing protein [Chloroflexi bacterium]|nr:pentapeptide repeat-containing protein [Chloroflexota bacterium]
MTPEFALLAISDKSLFEWADAVATPIIVVVIAGIFGLTARGTRQRAQADRELQDDRAREETLVSYLDRIAELVLEKALAKSEIASPERAVALALTHAALRTLDGRRKGLLIRFLNDSQLIRNGRAVVALTLADLTNSNLSSTDLRACDFSGANLSDADFYNADLRDCNLENCVLSNEQLAQCAGLAGAILPNGDLATEQTLDQLQSEDFEQWS